MTTIAYPGYGATDHAMQDYLNLFVHSVLCTHSNNRQKVAFSPKALSYRPLTEGGPLVWVVEGNTDIDGVAELSTIRPMVMDASDTFAYFVPDKTMSQSLFPKIDIYPTSEPILVVYKNYRGETAVRKISPLRLMYGATEWHPEPGWLMEAMDEDKGQLRSFAMTDMIPAIPEKKEA